MEKESGGRAGGIYSTDVEKKQTKNNFGHLHFMICFLTSKNTVQMLKKSKPKTILAICSV